LLDIKKLEKFDSRKMYKVYDNWPKIAKDQYETDIQEINFDKVSHIVFAGMGGSGAIGDIFASVLSKTDIHVDVVKGYQLPKTVNSESMVVTTSISGNTEETLTILKEAFETKSKVIAFSDGGLMEDFCQKKKINHQRISMIHSPRASFPTFLYSMIRVFQSFLPIDKNDVKNSLKILEEQKEKISSENLTDQNISLDLALWIKKIPLTYYPWGLEAAATRFKNSLQENTKIHAITEDVIEACHNGIVAWGRPSDVQPILIQGKDDHFKTKERWDVLREFFMKKEIEFKEIETINGGIFSKLINLIYLLDYSTIYKSVLLETDPSPVEPIDFVKRKLNL